MITGIAVLGTLAGSLASFFRLGDGGSSGSDPATTNMPDDAALAGLATEMTALRRQVEALTERLAAASPHPPREEPPASGDTPG